MKYLAHHGILGQKWGVRRYQNEDGTLTAAGKKRYQEGSSFGSKGRMTKSVDAANLRRTIDKESWKKPSADRDYLIRELKKQYSLLVKDLDPKEIRYGEVYVKAKGELQYGQVVGGYLGAAIASRNSMREYYALKKEFKNARKQGG